MESRTEVLARHQRELAELDSRWWESLFSKDPISDYDEFCLGDGRYPVDQWIRYQLPAIIRKREKIGVTVVRNHSLGTISTNQWCFSIDIRIAEKLAGRTLAPGEKVEI